MNAEHLQRFAVFVFDHEARKDKDGNRPAIYELPPNDGGGRYEIAGINERYDLETVTRLVKLIQRKEFGIAQAVCRAYYVSNTNAVATWSTSPAIEFFLRDTAFNRGVRGAAKIAQMAVDTQVDGNVGPITRAALAKADPLVLLGRLRIACANYEDAVAGARPNLRQGLINRWNDRLAFAKTFLPA
jgi:hypothetical protein